MMLSRVCGNPWHSGTRVGGITFILEPTYQVYIAQSKVLFLYLNNVNIRLLPAYLIALLGFVGVNIIAAGRSVFHDFWLCSS